MKTTFVFPLRRRSSPVFTPRSAFHFTRLWPACLLAVSLLSASALGANTFTRTGDLAGSLGSHTSTLLPDGTVLVAGGYNGSSILDRVDRYDPATGTYTVTSEHTPTVTASHKTTGFS